MAVSILTTSGASIQAPIDTPEQRGALAVATLALGGEVMRTEVVEVRA